MDHSKTCWYCAGDTMESTGSYFKCTSCGATWNEQPTPVMPDIKRGSVTWVAEDGSHHRVPAHHPTKSAIRRATKAREKESKPL